jgi:hypothetical protein
MSGRRSHPRFAVTSPWQGTLRVLRDVIVDRGSGNELVAISQAAGITGEVLTLDLIGGGLTAGMKVTVLESRPVIISGAVRHRIRLAPFRPAELTTGSEAVPAWTPRTAEAL